MNIPNASLKLIKEWSGAVSSLMTVLSGIVAVFVPDDRAKAGAATASAVFLVCAVLLWRRRHRPSVPDRTQTVDTRIRGLAVYEKGDQLPGRQRNNDAESFTNTILSVAHRIVILSGDSGTGKTSLLRAGVLPRLESSGFAVTHVPSPSSIHSAASRRRSQLPSKSLLEAQIRVISELVEKTRTSDQQHVVVIDHFESLLGAAKDPEDGAHIWSLVSAILARPMSILVIGIRADFASGLWALLQDNDWLEHSYVVGIGHPFQSEAEEILIDLLPTDAPSNLRSEILADLGVNNRIQLSELQVVLRTLSSRFSLRDYRRSGGAQKVLAASIDNAIRITPHRDATLQVLRHLVDVQMRAARPPMSTSQILEEVTGLAAFTHSHLLATLTQLEQSRIVTRHPDDGDGNELFGLAHDFLAGPVIIATSEYSTHRQSAIRLALHYSSEWSGGNRELMSKTHRRLIRRYAPDFVSDDRNLRTQLRRSTWQPMIIPISCAALLAVLAVGLTTLKAAWQYTYAEEQCLVPSELSTRFRLKTGSLRFGETLMSTTKFNEHSHRTLVRESKSGSVAIGDFPASNGSLSPSGRFVVAVNENVNAVIFDVEKQQLFELDVDLNSTVIAGIVGAEGNELLLLTCIADDCDCDGSSLEVGDYAVWSLTDSKWLPVVKASIVRQIVWVPGRMLAVLQGSSGDASYASIWDLHSGEMTCKLDDPVPLDASVVAIGDAILVGKHLSGDQVEVSRYSIDSGEHILRRVLTLRNQVSSSSEVVLIPVGTGLVILGQHQDADTPDQVHINWPVEKQSLFTEIEGLYGARSLSLLEPVESDSDVWRIDMEGDVPNKCIIGQKDRVVVWNGETANRLAEFRINGHIEVNEYPEVIVEFTETDQVKQLRSYSGDIIDSPFAEACRTGGSIEWSLDGQHAIVPKSGAAYIYGCEDGSVMYPVPLPTSPQGYWWFDADSGVMINHDVSGLVIRWESGISVAGRFVRGREWLGPLLNIAVAMSGNVDAYDRKIWKSQNE